MCIVTSCYEYYNDIHDLLLPLAPEPPSALRGNPHPTTRNTYTFTWTPPTVTNGDLLEYMLICVPLDREMNEELVIMIPSPAERGEVGGFPYGVEYECVVRVRNSASYSQDSNSVEVIFMQSCEHRTTRHAIAMVMYVCVYIIQCLGP